MRLSLLMLLLGLAACSPYSYSKEVSAISTGVTQLSNGFTSGYTALASDRESETQLTLTDTRARVSVATSCDDPTSKLPCGLYRFGGSAPALSAIEQDRSKTMEAIAVLKGYADALAAVTNAADRTAYDAAVAQLSGAVGTLAKTADPAAPGVSTVAPAFVNIIGWLVVLLLTSNASIASRQPSLPSVHRKPMVRRQSTPWRQPLVQACWL